MEYDATADRCNVSTYKYVHTPIVYGCIAAIILVLNGALSANTLTAGGGSTYCTVDG
jgi:hypothetical protein